MGESTSSNISYHSSKKKNKYILSHKKILTKEETREFDANAGRGEENGICTRNSGKSSFSLYCLKLQQQE
eukprot:c40056_g1_i1 orf=346-555(-)